MLWDGADTKTTAKVGGGGRVEGLTHALRHATFDLALRQHRADNVADVIDRGVADDTHLTRSGIDFALANVTAIRPARPGRGEAGIAADA